MSALALIFVSAAVIVPLAFGTLMLGNSIVAEIAISLMIVPGFLIGAGIAAWHHHVEPAGRGATASIAAIACVGLMNCIWLVSLATNFEETKRGTEPHFDVPASK